MLACCTEVVVQDQGFDTSLLGEGHPPTPRTRCVWSDNEIYGNNDRLSDISTDIIPFSGGG